jgi:hypothetical protein
VIYLCIILIRCSSYYYLEASSPAVPHVNVPSIAEPLVAQPEENVDNPAHTDRGTSTQAGPATQDVEEDGFIHSAPELTPEAIVVPLTCPNGSRVGGELRTYL